jgi:hypothetical protein
MKSLIRITFPEEQASAHAELLWKEAPDATSKVTHGDIAFTRTAAGSS